MKGGARMRSVMAAEFNKTELKGLDVEDIHKIKDPDLLYKIGLQALETSEIHLKRARLMLEEQERSKVS